MRNVKWPKISLLAIPTLFLWLKTYIAYKTSFSIPIDNVTQEIILFINPLSFLLIVFGLSMFLKEKNQGRYIFILYFLLSAVLYANVVYYREFHDFITLPLLFQTDNLGDLGGSIVTLIHPLDILYFVDVVILALLMWHKPNFLIRPSYSKRIRRAYFLVAFAIAFFNLGLAEAERPQLLTRTFDREILVKNIGTYNYHLYDIFLQSKTSAQRALADGSELADIENYVRANYKEPNPELFGAAKGKNVIVISMESTQSFVIGEKINGEEVTPFLNDFIKESFYFENFYSQVGQGKTSDSEFLVDNSLYPLSRGAVFFTHSGNEYEALPEILNENGYFTASLHANNSSFWNRDVMYQSLGYQKFYDVEDYEVPEDETTEWGLLDIPFFEQSIDHLKEMPKPFYAKFITLTNHYPFELAEEYKWIDEYNSNSGTLNRYFPTVRYTDEAIKLFIEQLKAEGIYQDSIIIIYGDHYGISQNHNKAMSQLLGEEVTPFVHTQLQRVPLIIHIPGMEGKTMETVGGQIDLKPTLLHLLGISTKGNIDFGSDLFAEDRLDYALQRDGSFVTKDYLYAENVCYSKQTEEPVDISHCQPFIDMTVKELEYSDKIIYGDLLRFYGENASKEEANKNTNKE
ncbi:MAG TPA: LTA synthase family protein [Bacillus sp. (in: firmicutes)]|uniref:LTA synthase family protein n=1 Tax=Bacillus litorisediminis TaxID=2922713 RepID=UPI001FAB4672|nr:LTA synthase family protein [Bacillus litorisediminis]HWO77631.1 LTA synthase family protein [Bacillus sp. (in: firmicutes)]